MSYFHIPKRILSKPTRKANYQFNPSEFAYILHIHRVYDLDFIFNYTTLVDSCTITARNRGDFPLVSNMTVYGKELESPQASSGIGKTIDMIYCREQLGKFRVLENAPYMIPSGCYEVVFACSPKFCEDMPYIIDVPNRSGIMFHAGNTAKDSKGCILVGSSLTPDISSIRVDRSSDSFKKFCGFFDTFGIDTESRKILLIIDSEINPNF